MAAPAKINIVKCEGGWTLSLTRAWVDYSGVLSVENQSDELIRNLLERKPKLIEMAFANEEYTITQVGENVMVKIDLKTVDESMTVELAPIAQSQTVVTRQLQQRISELESQVRELSQIGKPYTQTPTVTDELLLRYAAEYSSEYKTFLAAQINMTAVDAFAKWLDTLGDMQCRLHTEYVARVRCLSMIVPYWYTGNPSSIGMYTKGCWQITKAEFELTYSRLLGPFFNTNNYEQFWLTVTELEPISDADKNRLNLE